MNGYLEPNVIATLLGAFLGALITGLVAIVINKKTEKNRRKEKLELENKIVNILKFYLSTVKNEGELILKLKSERNGIKDPFDGIPLIQDDDGEEHYLYPPLEFEIEDYERLVEPLDNELLKVIEGIIDNSEKILSIDLLSLKREFLDEFLNIITLIKKNCLPNFEDINSKKKIYLLEEKHVRELVVRISEFEKNLI